MSEQVRAVVEVKWLLAAFPEAEMVGEVLRLNGSAFPVTTLVPEYDDWIEAHVWLADDGWADDLS
jgi:hypothetical protein